ncbi:MAG: inositol-3-phosphate synthase [Nitrososphaerota archaeon]|nr:inositol-3-phosphate synthase [Nitrososphaerota archaeon]MDG6939469.1 inositol-3-phosphate synthase [Nitrososphaerota archaeon]
MSKVRVALAGIGNCSSALLQGTRYYRAQDEATGLLSYSLGGITPSDIEFVTAFDVDAGKVGKDLSEAIFCGLNNTPKFCDVEETGVRVKRGPLLDGLGKYLSRVIKPSGSPEVDVAKELKDSGAEILVNYLPVGSTKAVQWYAEQALKAGVAFINAMPVFIASNEPWAGRFEQAGLPVAGDDVMSQIGATVLHKTLIKLLHDRGAKVDETYQLNIGGDTDFLNMLEEQRLVDKRESKTSAVRAMTPYPVPTRIGPSDYVDFLKNDKVCYIWVKGRYFGNTPVTIEAKLHVVDAPDSGGVMIDAIRGTKIALDRGVSGQLTSLSSYCFKHPPVQLPYDEAKRRFLAFVDGKAER